MFQIGDTVNVVDAPGYEDFTGELAWFDADWPKCVIIPDDTVDLFVVPLKYVKEYVSE